MLVLDFFNRDLKSTLCGPNMTEVYHSALKLFLLIILKVAVYVIVNTYSCIF
jgi:hypothetical protein